MALSLPSPVDLLFPPRCVVCERILTLGASICPDCAGQLQPTGSHAKQPLEGSEGCYSPFYYAEPLRASFLRYKFNGDVSHAIPYGRWMADCLVAQGETNFDFVTWAPLNKWRRRRRGYDQAQLLARQVGRQLKLPVVPTLKKAYRRPLSRLEGTLAVRRARILGAYRVRRGKQIAGKRILLVDDVITSGATLSECVRQLRLAGAAEVVCVTLARKHSD
jgi:ComF family protein